MNKTRAIILVGIMLVALALATPAMAADATRNLSGDCVEPGADFAVTITASNYGNFGKVDETLCYGWVYQSVTGDVGEDQVQIDGNTISFLMMGSGPTTFTYTVQAPNDPCCCDLSGVLVDAETHDHVVAGPVSVCVCAGGAPPDTPDLSEIVEDELKKLAPGQILFNPPKKMRVGVRERVEVRISKNITEDLSTELKGRGEPQIENIEVGDFMKVSLTGDNFDIKPLSEENQVVLNEDFTMWEYDVIPNKSGNQILQLKVAVRIKIPGEEETYSCPVLERDINVKVNPIYSSHIS